MWAPTLRSRCLRGPRTSFYASLCVGASGGILALACVMPGACMQLFQLTQAGKHVEALDLQRRLVPAARLLGSRFGVAGLKAALALIGCDVGQPRAPLPPIDDAGIATLRETLAIWTR